MFYSLLTLLVAFLVDLLSTHSKTSVDKDLEILALRHQLRLLQRHQKSKPRRSRFEKLLLAVLAVKLKALLEHGSNHLDQCLRLFKPETVLKWHRELVRRKWTVRSIRKRGRPQISPELEALVIRLARENRRWGTDRIHGELFKRGFRISATTIRAVLQRLPCSARSPTWCQGRKLA
jgi:putative transposase